MFYNGTAQETMKLLKAYSVGAAILDHTGLYIQPGPSDWRWKHYFLSSGWWWWIAIDRSIFWSTKWCLFQWKRASSMEWVHSHLRKSLLRVAEKRMEIWNNLFAENSTPPKICISRWKKIWNCVCSAVLKIMCFMLCTASGKLLVLYRILV